MSLFETIEGLLIFLEDIGIEQADTFHITGRDIELFMKKYESGEMRLGVGVVPPPALSNQSANEINHLHNSPGQKSGPGNGGQ